MNLYLFPTSRDFWLVPEVATSVEQASQAARRIAKGIEVSRERTRLRAALQVIERAVRAAVPNPRLLKDADAESALRILPRIGPTRLPFYLADDEGTLGGFLLAAIPYSTEPSPATASQSIKSGSPVGLADVDQGVPSQANNSRHRLIREIESARVTGRPAPLGRARHVEITLAMRSFLRARPNLQPFDLRFIYTIDGSESGPVRLAQVPTRPTTEPTVELAIGLNSCRHFDLDPEVDMYLLRNAEFDRSDTERFRDQEDRAYSSMLKLLDSYRQTSLGVRLYHTGLEPAVIGAYRAVVDALIEGRSLIVTPVFFVGGRNQEPWW